MTKILAVDDSASMRQMVVFTLESAGYDVVEAVDGQQALDIVKNESFDLVLSDINMPVMNGIELVKQLRQLEAYKYTPILMLTTETSSDRKMAGKGAGATGWVVKPFNPDKLLATIKKVIS